ncbi:MFS transporter [Pseudomonas putida]|nr:MFS transporter [Pseudomonas putida]
MSRSQFLLVLCAQTLMLAAFQGLKLAAPLYALSIGVSDGAVGALVALFAASQIFLAIPIGRYADKKGLHAPMAYAAVGSGGMLFLGGLHPEIVIISVVAVALGAANCVTLIVMQRHVGRADLSDESRRNYFGWLAISPALSSSLGPLAAGLIIDLLAPAKGDYVAFQYCFAFLALLSCSSWLFTRKVIATRSVSIPSEPKAPAWNLLKSANFRGILFVNWLQSTVWDVHSFIVPVIGFKAGYSASTIGIILGGFALAAAAIRLVLPILSKRFSEKQIIACSCIVAVIVFSLYPFAHTPLIMFTCSTVLGAALGCVQPMILTMLVQVTPLHRQGEAFGIRLTALNASNFLVPIVAGSFSGLVGLSSVFWMVSALMILGIPKIRNIQIR